MVMIFLSLLVSACPRVWDGVLCWPPTPNGTVASLNCPDYVSGFVVTGIYHEGVSELGLAMRKYMKPVNNLKTTWGNGVFPRLFALKRR